MSVMRCRYSASCTEILLCAAASPPKKNRNMDGRNIGSDCNMINSHRAVCLCMHIVSKKVSLQCPRVVTLRILTSCYLVEGGKIRELGCSADFFS